MFEIGQRVVCISAGPWFDLDGTRFYGHAPKENHVYIIKGFRVGDASPIVGHLYLYLDGFDGNHWNSEWFRPVIPRKTSIEVFKQILVKPPKVPVNV